MKIEREKIDWKKDPQDSFGTREITSQEGLEEYQRKSEETDEYYFYVDVWNIKARLGVMHDEGATAKSEVVDEEEYGLTKEELEDAVESQGGTINMSGHYALTQKLKEKVKSELEEISKRECEGK